MIGQTLTRRSDRAWLERLQEEVEADAQATSAAFEVVDSAIVRQQRAVEILLQAVRRLDEKCAHILLMLEGRDA